MFLENGTNIFIGIVAQRNIAKQISIYVKEMPVFSYVQKLGAQSCVAISEKLTVWELPVIYDAFSEGQRNSVALRRIRVIEMLNMAIPIEIIEIAGKWKSALRQNTPTRTKSLKNNLLMRLRKCIAQIKDRKQRVA